MSKILYIEDNRLSSRLVKKLLSRVGLEVLQARTGEARKIAEDLQLTFMDLETIGNRNGACG